MKKWLDKFKKQKGSATIEFLGIIPLAFLLILILWQFLVAMHGVLITQSAANEYAKVYSITENATEAAQSAGNILAESNSLSYTINGPNYTSSKEFTTQINVNINLVVLPNELFGYSSPSIPYSAESSSRVIE
ncbi:TadE/TadG family type IV pilus assembly protein [Gracilibacillus boraciitolerans]|uniref:TadE/TadG family type IV pilus assembly protein n=1 Tax=Gracilibacillus boraciitolerans TaxID=307521 RepID=UPI00054E0A83|nr:TadE family protein [Gracilibacillus boraciitolerans]